MAASLCLDNPILVETLSETNRRRNAKLSAPEDVKKERINAKCISFNQQINVAFIRNGVVGIVNQGENEKTRFQHELHEYMAAEALDTLLKSTRLPEQEFVDRVIGTDPLVRSSVREQLFELRRRAMAIRPVPSLQEKLDARNGATWTDENEAEYQDLVLNQQSQTLFPLCRTTRNLNGYTVDECLTELMDHLVWMF